MMRQLRKLLVLMLTVVGVQLHAQSIDSFHVNRSANPHELFVRLRFPDSSYYVARTFDRVALMYPPVNIVTFFYRSCQFVKANPVRDTMIGIYTPEPYKLLVWLVRDSNTSTPGCVMAPEIQNVDSVLYDATHLGIAGTNPADNAIYIFPNPAKNLLHITGTPGCDIRITDALGRLQLQQKLNNSRETVDVSALAPALYYLHGYRDGQLLQSHCFSKLP